MEHTKPLRAPCWKRRNGAGRRWESSLLLRHVLTKRNKYQALDEQKRVGSELDFCRSDLMVSFGVQKRAQRVDSTRNLDLFADLNLGDSDDEQEDAGIVPMGIASYASLLSPAESSSGAAGHGHSGGCVVCVKCGGQVQAHAEEEQGKKKWKQKAKSQPPAANSEWGDKCMYAELLELSGDDSWSGSGPDGLPENLETGWVAGPHILIAIAIDRSLNCPSNSCPGSRGQAVSRDY
jgi:hypothetical protein